MKQQGPERLSSQGPRSKHPRCWGRRGGEGKREEEQEEMRSRRRALDDLRVSGLLSVATSEAPQQSFCFSNVRGPAPWCLGWQTNQQEDEAAIQQRRGLSRRRGEERMGLAMQWTRWAGLGWGAVSSGEGEKKWWTSGCCFFIPPHLLSVPCIPCPVLGKGGTAGNMTKTLPTGAYILVGETNKESVIVTIPLVVSTIKETTVFLRTGIRSLQGWKI